jgi:hypothetical protein
MIWGLKDQAVSRALSNFRQDQVQEGCHQREIRKRCQSNRLAGLMPFRRESGWDRRSILEQPLWKSRLCVASFSPLFSCLFLLIWFSYPIHLFFLFRSKFFHLTLQRAPRYLNS